MKGFKKGDKLLCIETPSGPVNPNIKKGMTGIVIKTPNSMSSGAELAIQIIGKKGPIKKYYALCESDATCYKKIKEADIDSIIEQEIMALGGN